MYGVKETTFRNAMYICRVQKYPTELGPNNGNNQYYERPYATGQVNFYPTTNQVGYQPTNMVQAPGTAFGTVVNYPPPGSFYPGTANVPMPYPYPQQPSPYGVNMAQLQAPLTGGDGGSIGNVGVQQLLQQKRTQRLKRSMVKPMKDSGSHWGVHRLLSTGLNFEYAVANIQLLSKLNNYTE